MENTEARRDELRRQLNEVEEQRTRIYNSLKALTEQEDVLRQQLWTVTAYRDDVQRELDALSTREDA